MPAEAKGSNGGALEVKKKMWPISERGGENCQTLSQRSDKQTIVNVVRVEYRNIIQHARSAVLFSQYLDNIRSHKSRTKVSFQF
jgi:hypothetical protein